MALLEVKDLTAAYGGIQALRGVSLTVEAVSYTHLTLPTKA